MDISWLVFLSASKTAGATGTTGLNGLGAGGSTSGVGWEHAMKFMTSMTCIAKIRKSTVQTWFLCFNWFTYPSLQDFWVLRLASAATKLNHIESKFIELCWQRHIFDCPNSPRCTLLQLSQPAHASWRDMYSILQCIYIYIFSAFFQDEKALMSSLHSKWVCHMLSIRTLCKPKFYGFGWNSSCMYCTVLCAEELNLEEKELWPTSLSAPVFLPSTKVPCRRRLPDLSDSHGMSWWSLMQRINMDRQHWGENVEFRLPSSFYEFLTVLDPLWDRQIEQSD